jgi:hypothetical protein
VKVFIRMSPDEKKKMEQNARKYSGGNLSKWIRDRCTEPMLDVSIDMQDAKDD